MINKFLFLSILMALSFGYVPQAVASPDCSMYSETVAISFPTVNPVWELCARPIVHSTPQPNGSGLEIFEVHYNGHLVMQRGNLPVLNVQYGQLGCGCFRDWTDREAFFDANAISCSDQGVCNVDAPTQDICDCAPSNSCDADPNNACNVDIGSYKGMAIHEAADRLTLSTLARAGWYRYSMKWVFHLDGSIEPKFKFGATTNACTTTSHMHNAYYRFDFDIGGAANDQVSSVSTLLSGLDDDNDGIDNTIDNCSTASNPAQIDADGDGFGNYCDADFNNDNVTNLVDFQIFAGTFLTTDPVTDLTNDGVVNFVDVNRFAQLFLTVPGPAGPGSIATPINTETSAFAGAGENWTVTDTASNRGYKIIPGANDFAISDEGGINDPEGFAVADYWVLANQVDEQSDNSFDCEADLNSMVNAEATADSDVVFWYRFGAHHVGLDECFCSENGPRLEPVGDWSPAN